METEVEGVSLPSVKLHTQRSCTEPAHHPQLVPVCVCACTHVVQYTPRCLPFCPAVPGDSTQQNVLGAHPRGSLGLSPPPAPRPVKGREPLGAQVVLSAPGPPGAQSWVAATGQVTAVNAAEGTWGRALPSALGGSPGGGLLAVCECSTHLPPPALSRLTAKVGPYL